MAPFLSVVAGVLIANGVNAAVPLKRAALPALAQVIDQKSLNALPMVPPPVGYNASSVSTAPPDALPPRS